MRPEDIKLRSTYRGGKNGELRFVIRYGASDKYVCWAHPRERLVYGGFSHDTCTSRASFAKWATEEVADV